MVGSTVGNSAADVVDESEIVVGGGVVDETCVVRGAPTGSDVVGETVVDVVGLGVLETWMLSANRMLSYG